MVCLEVLYAVYWPDTGLGWNWTAETPAVEITNAINLSLLNALRAVAHLHTCEPVSFSALTLLPSALFSRERVLPGVATDLPANVSPTYAVLVSGDHRVPRSIGCYSTTDSNCCTIATRRIQTRFPCRKSSARLARSRIPNGKLCRLYGTSKRSHSYCDN